MTSESLSTRIYKTPSASLAIPSVQRSTRNKTDFQYVLQPDHYFLAASAKSKTSNHTLDRLKNSRVQPDELMKLIANLQLSEEHKQAIKGLNEEHVGNFEKWMMLLDEGFSILLFGFGSKRNLLQKFHEQKLSQENVVIINGFFPSLTIKEILDFIWVDMLKQTSFSGNPHEIVNKIQEEMEEVPAYHLFVIIHNIDGAMLRNNKAQSVLSRLANIKNLHMIASIDHINAPLCKFTLNMVVLKLILYTFFSVE